MQNITTVSGLKDAILLLKAEQYIKGQLLKEQVYITYESLKPVNLLRKSLHDISTSPDLIENILGTGIGLASGFLTKRVFVGKSGNMFRKLIGSVLQFGVTNFVAQHPDTIKSIEQSILQYFLRRKEAKSEENGN